MFRSDGSVACYSTHGDDGRLVQVCSDCMCSGELLWLQEQKTIMGQIKGMHFYGLNLNLPEPAWIQGTLDSQVRQLWGANLKSLQKKEV